MESVSIAICGLGRAGSIHIGNCLQNKRINIKYLVEIDLERAETVKRDYGLSQAIVLHADDFKKVQDDPDVKGVIITTVTYTHEAFVKKCIEAKKAIFCEKPISEKLSTTLSCYDEASKNKVPLFCAFNRRFDPTHASLQEAVKNGEVGKVHMVKICSRDSPLPSEAYLKISGGIFHDCAVHDIDMASWVLGEYPTEVFVYAHAFRKFINDMGDVDTVSINMKFPSGAIGQIDLSRLAVYGYDQRVEVFGDGGMLESLNQNKTSLRKSTGQDISNDLIKFSFPQRYRDAYVAEIDHFLDIIDGKVEPFISRTDVGMVSLIASACEESHKTGKPMKINKENWTFEPAV